VTILFQFPVISTLRITLDIGISLHYAGPASVLVDDKLGPWCRTRSYWEFGSSVGPWDPSKELKNMVCAIVNVRSPGYKGDDSWTVLLKKYVDIVEQLEDDIES
jgi:hypothetical protein